MPSALQLLSGAPEDADRRGLRHPGGQRSLDFSLDAEDIAAISALDENRRLGSNPATFEMGRPTLRNAAEGPAAHICGGAFRITWPYDPLALL
ncbi:hypothetical protein QF035_010617 [Streptomyces umbrinus]|uniref:Uncharacterized protein n=1 Tax=Streptomyces umbrinus TaxID=67370 RepID=A0ABU0TB39_9ACTN|nr:hypothetical protein [Streptomyces umbrinus]